MTDIGLSYKSSTDADMVQSLFGDTPPAFRRLFVPMHAGLPNLDGIDMQKTPRSTVPWWSHKDPPTLANISRIGEMWTRLAEQHPGRKIRWTFQHEANDLDWLTHRRGWRELAAMRLDHQYRERVELTTIISGYYARYKSNGRWVEYVLPEYAQGVAFDLYAPTDRPGYEDPASILGVVDQAHADFGAGMSVGVAEFGSPLIGRDIGPARAAWFGRCINHAVREQYDTFGLWHSHEVRDGVKYDYRARDTYALASWQGAMKRHGANKWTASTSS